MATPEWVKITIEGNRVQVVTKEDVWDLDFNDQAFLEDKVDCFLNDLLDGPSSELAKKELGKAFMEELRRE